MKTVLIAEDDKHINGVVSESLKEAGYSVLSFMDGESAQNVITEGKPVDMFVLDIMLPKVTGLSLLKTIRSERRYNNVPVMMLTAIQDEYTQLLSFDEQADDYVTKPFSPKVLVKRVQALLRRNEKNESEKKEVELSGITIDADTYQACEDGKSVKLTLREFELLKLFMQNPNLVYTRQQLLDAVWGYDYFGDERIVDTHIKNLRKKFSKPIVATVKGVGYRAETGGENL